MTKPAASPRATARSPSPTGRDRRGGRFRLATSRCRRRAGQIFAERDPQDQRLGLAELAGLVETRGPPPDLAQRLDIGRHPGKPMDRILLTVDQRAIDPAAGACTAGRDAFGDMRPRLAQHRFGGVQRPFRRAEQFTVSIAAASGILRRTAGGTANPMPGPRGAGLAMGSEDPNCNPWSANKQRSRRCRRSDSGCARASASFVPPRCRR